MKLLILAITTTGIFITSCASYDHPSKQLTVAENGKIAGYELRKVKRDSVFLVRPETRSAFLLKQSETKEFGSNARLKLIACHPKSHTADFEHNLRE